MLETTIQEIILEAKQQPTLTIIFFFFVEWLKCFDKIDFDDSELETFFSMEQKCQNNHR